MLTYTSTYNYKGKDRLDITVKGSTPFGKYFAPTWTMVNLFKNGVMSEKEYTRAYIIILDRVPEIIWKKLLEKDKITLVCFCKPDSFCHRFLLAKELEKRGAIYKGERKKQRNNVRNLFKKPNN